MPRRIVRILLSNGVYTIQTHGRCRVVKLRIKSINYVFEKTIFLNTGTSHNKFIHTLVCNTVAQQTKPFLLPVCDPDLSLLYHHLLPTAGRVQTKRNVREHSRNINQIHCIDSPHRRRRRRHHHCIARDWLTVSG